MSPLNPGCASPAVALTCGYQYYEADRDALVPPEATAPRIISPSSSPELASTPKSTGCGALLHSSAAMTMATWCAPAVGVTSNVIPLEARYFDLGAATLLRLGTLADCGCAMDGVGCQLCGNALGARFSSCVAHTHTPAASAFGYRYTFLPNAVWPGPCRVSPPLDSSSAPPSRTSSNSPPHAAHGRDSARIQSIVEREVQAYAALVRTAFPPQRRLDAQSLGVPRDFVPSPGALISLLSRPGSSVPTPESGAGFGAYTDTDTDVFEGYEEVYSAGEPARAVREGGDTLLGASGSGGGRQSVAG